MVEILGIPLPRGNLTFHVEEFERGRAFFNDDKSIRIDIVKRHPIERPVGRKYVNNVYMRLRYKEVDTIVLATSQEEYIKDGDSFKFLSWQINFLSQPTRYFISESSAHFEHMDFKGYDFARIDEEIQCLRIITDFLWLSDGSNINGTFEVKHVGIHKVIYEGLFGDGKLH